MDLKHAIVKPAWRSVTKSNFAPMKDFSSRSQLAVRRGTCGAIRGEMAGCLNNAAANCRTGGSVIHFHSIFSRFFGRSHCWTRRGITRLRRATTRQQNHMNIRQRAFFGGTLETCDEVTHAAEPVKFDNLRKSAQR
jgi:hypothetical protein